MSKAVQKVNKQVKPYGFGRRLKAFAKYIVWLPLVWLAWNGFWLISFLFLPIISWFFFLEWQLPVCRFIGKSKEELFNVTLAADAVVPPFVIIMGWLEPIGISFSFGLWGICSFVGWCIAAWVIIGILTGATSEGYGRLRKEKELPDLGPVYQFVPLLAYGGIKIGKWGGRKLFKKLDKWCAEEDQEEAKQIESQTEEPIAVDDELQRMIADREEAEKLLEGND